MLRVPQQRRGVIFRRVRQLRPAVHALLDPLPLQEGQPQGCLPLLQRLQRLGPGGLFAQLFGLFVQVLFLLLQRLRLFLQFHLLLPESPASGAESLLAHVQLLTRLIQRGPALLDAGLALLHHGLHLGHLSLGFRHLGLGLRHLRLIAAQRVAHGIQHGPDLLPILPVSRLEERKLFLADGGVGVHRRDLIPLLLDDGAKLLHRHARGLDNIILQVLQRLSADPFPGEVLRQPAQIDTLLGEHVCQHLHLLGADAALSLQAGIDPRRLVQGLEQTVVGRHAQLLPGALVLTVQKVAHRPAVLQLGAKAGERVLGQSQGAQPFLQLALSFLELAVALPEGGLLLFKQLPPLLVLGSALGQHLLRLVQRQLAGADAAAGSGVNGQIHPVLGRLLVMGGPGFLQGGIGLPVVLAPR